MPVRGTGDRGSLLTPLPAPPAPAKPDGDTGALAPAVAAAYDEIQTQAHVVTPGALNANA